MEIGKIADIASNRDGFNFRIRTHTSKHSVSESINIKLYKKVNNCIEALNEMESGFKYGYNSITGEWKHHKGIKDVSCFYED